MKLKYVAVIQCEWRDEGADRCCTETAEFTVPVEEVTPEVFAGLAAYTFRKQGWVCCSPGRPPHNLCPRHA